MTDQFKVTRRTFMATNAAAAASVTLPAAATAATTAGSAALEVAGAKSAAAAPLRWSQVTAEGLSQLVGERFRIRSEEFGSIVVRLLDAEPVNSGPDRPSDLGRTEGVIAVFDSPDKDPLVGCGHGTYRVTHPKMGSADLFLGPSCVRSGGHVIELVLN